jgi:hypothetical protein
LGRSILFVSSIENLQKALSLSSLRLQHDNTACGLSSLQCCHLSSAVNHPVLSTIQPCQPSSLVISPALSSLQHCHLSSVVISPVLSTIRYCQPSSLVISPAFSVFRLHKISCEVGFLGTTRFQRSRTKAPPPSIKSINEVCSETTSTLAAM